MELCQYKNKQEEQFWFSNPEFMLTVIHLQEIALITMFVVSFSLLGHFYRHSLASLYIFSAALGLHVILHFIFTPNLITKLCVASNLVLLRKEQFA